MTFERNVQKNAIGTKIWLLNTFAVEAIIHEQKYQQKSCLLFTHCGLLNVT